LIGSVSRRLSVCICWQWSGIRASSGRQCISVVSITTRSLRLLLQQHSS